MNSWNSDIMKEEIISETKEHEMSDNLAELDNAYDTIDQAIKAVDRFCNDNGHPIRVYSKCTVGQHNRKTKGEELQIRDLPETHIHSLRWVCKHFGKEEVRIIYFINFSTIFSLQARVGLLNPVSQPSATLHSQQLTRLVLVKLNSFDTSDDKK